MSKKTEKVTTDKVDTATKPSTLTHVAKTGGFVSKKAMSTKKALSLTDRFLADFLAIESEVAAAKSRTSLLVAFADGINWPFRTKEATVNGEEMTIVQVSSSWIKQNIADLSGIRDAFRRFCENGHLVDAAVQSVFDSTFKRPAFTYNCTCGWSYTLSYRMITELDDKACPSCGKSAREMTIS